MFIESILCAEHFLCTALFIPLDTVVGSVNYFYPSRLSVSGDLPKEDAILIKEGGGKPSTRELQGDHPLNLLCGFAT